MGKSQFTGCILSFTGAILSAYNFHTLKPAIKLLVLNILVNRKEFGVLTILCEAGFLSNCAHLKIRHP